MRRLLAGAALAACIWIPAAQAQEAPTLVVTPLAPDPQRLAAARELIEVIMPAEGRDAMFEAMLNQMMATMVSGMTKTGEFDRLSADPRFRKIMGSFFERQRLRALAIFREATPELITAYANAYARTFSLEDMKAMTAFFDTPAGRRYTQNAPKLLGDPDIAAWMQRIMAESRNGIPEEKKRLLEELAPLMEEKRHAS